MVWYLLLAHFIGDYPLQPAWMVRNKTRLWVLLLHVTIHFGILLSLFWESHARVWNYLVLLVVIHLGLDAGKNWFNLRYPAWNIWSYFIDQACHVLSIVLVASALERLSPPLMLSISRVFVVYLLGFLLATYVWLVTERVLTGSRLDGKSLAGARLAWPRMYIRLLMLTFLLSGWKLFYPTAAALVIPQISSTTANSLRTLLVDLAVSSSAAILIIVAAR